MDDSYIHKLCSRAGKELSASRAGSVNCQDAGLMQLLDEKNGFFAFESALHVFPVGSADLGFSQEQWNSKELWKHAYGDAVVETLFFAEDIFGEQFGIKNGNVCRFNPETAIFTEFAESVAAWAGRILYDPDVELGYGLVAYWQSQNRKLLSDERLVPLVPFVAGGQYDLTNLFAVNCVEGMKRRAALAKQIKSLPDGTKIKLKWVRE